MSLWFWLKIDYSDSKSEFHVFFQELSFIAATVDVKGIEDITALKF